MPEGPSAPTNEPSPPPVPRRFSWPMRFFLGVMLFFLVYRPFCILYPWKDWLEHLQMDDAPARLATRAEREKLAASASPEKPFPVTDSLLGTLDSVWGFFKPWPGANTRARIRERRDYATFAVCWVNSRAHFVEALLLYNTEWSMFSPSVSTRKSMPRARLIYADGSTDEVASDTEPADRTHYFRFCECRVLNYQFKVRPGASLSCAGYCNWLAHRHAEKDGAPLKTIRLYVVSYDLPAPGVDGRAYWQDAQPEGDDDFYEYDVAERHGRKLDAP